MWAPPSSSPGPRNTAASQGNVPVAPQDALATAAGNPHMASPAVSWGASQEEASAQRVHDASQERRAIRPSLGHVANPPRRAAPNMAAPSSNTNLFEGSRASVGPLALEELRRERDQWKELQEREALEAEIRSIKASLRRTDRHVPGNYKR